MEQAEWLARYKARLLAQAGISEEFAQDCVDAQSFAELSDGFEDDPEDAADEELSYWTE